MEFLIGFALIAVILLLLGFGIGDIAYLAFGIMLLIMIFTGGFFLIVLALLLSSKRVFGEYCDMDENGKYPRAVYLIGEKRMVNLFPCEMVAREKLYVPGKTVRLFRCRPVPFVIDRNAFFTIVFGSAVFIPGAVFSVFLLVDYFMRIAILL